VCLHFFLLGKWLNSASGSAVQEPEIPPFVSSEGSSLSGDNKPVLSGPPPVDRPGYERKDCLPMFGIGRQFSPASLCAVPALCIAAS
jgi:hypothetical protein